MKVFLCMIAILFCVAALFAFTNPGADDFKLWYQVNYENPIRTQMNDEIQKSLDVGNGTLQVLVDGAYEILAKDKMQSIIQMELDKMWNDVKVDRFTFFTFYYIYLPDGKLVTVTGYLNKFRADM